MQQLSNLFLLVVLFVTSLSTTLNAAALKKGKTYIIVTSAGRVYAGTLIKETKTSVVLKLKKSKKKPVTILKADIEEIREAKKAIAAQQRATAMFGIHAESPKRSSSRTGPLIH